MKNAMCSTGDTPSTNLTILRLGARVPVALTGLRCIVRAGFGGLALYASALASRIGRRGILQPRSERGRRVLGEVIVVLGSACLPLSQ